MVGYVLPSIAWIVRIAVYVYVMYAVYTVDANRAVRTDTAVKQEIIL